METEFIAGICSMATRQLIAAMCLACHGATGMKVRFESVGGVDAAKRVLSGERFDVVVLASDAMDELTTAGTVVAGSVRPVAESNVAVAVGLGVERADIASETALRGAVLKSRRIAYSTGPSGRALLRLFAQWGLADVLKDRLIQAPSGIPVAELLASGQADIGFQQMSELKDAEGITLLGPMPRGLEIKTMFVGAIGASSERAADARAVLSFMCSPQTRELKLRHGMQEASKSEAQSTQQREL